MYWNYSHAFFVDLLKKIAPERAGELDDIIKRHGIVFVVDDATASHRFRANLDTHEIKVSTRCDARLWAYAYTYLKIYAALAKRTPTSDTTPILPAEKIVAHLGLLEWAVSQDIGAIIARRSGDTRDEDPLPEGAPTPFVSLPESRETGIAGGLALFGLGYILLHEIAHVILGHNPGRGADAIRNEKEADFWAAEWMAGPFELLPEKRKPRVVGIALGLMYILTLDIYSGPKESDTHPPSYDRLFQTLDRVVGPDDTGSTGESHLVWSFVQVAIALHLNKNGTPLPIRQKFSTFKELVDVYIDTISRIPKREG